MRKNEVIRSRLFPDLPTKFHFFTVTEVAIILGTTNKKVHEWIEQGLLRSFRMGPNSKLTRVSYQDLENFIDAHVRTGEFKLPDKDIVEEKKEESQTDQPAKPQS
jgi:excisionase family DNA binding protein